MRTRDEIKKEIDFLESRLKEYYSQINGNMSYKEAIRLSHLSLCAETKINQLYWFLGENPIYRENDDILDILEKKLGLV